MRARNRGMGLDTRKKNIEREMRRLGQVVGEIDPGWGNMKGVSDRRRKYGPEDGGLGTRRSIGISGREGAVPSEAVSVGGGLDGGGET
jgi:hypothetical protein